jgi:hypothetical protein
VAEAPQVILCVQDLDLSEAGLVRISLQRVPSHHLAADGCLFQRGEV